MTGTTLMQRTAIPAVDVESIATPQHLLLTIQEGRISDSVISEAEAKGYDFLPLVELDGSLIGIAPVPRLRSLIGSRISRDDDEVGAVSIPDRLSILELLKHLAENGVVAVLDTDNARPEGWFALLTPADLNRHVFRGYLYPLFALLESELARLIATEYDLETRETVDKFVKKIPKYNRATVLGRWELDKIDNVETGLLAGCTLSDLLEILRQTKPLVHRIGISGNKLSTLSNSLNDLRNEVMHPVRPIVRGEDGVNELLNNITDLISLIERVQTVLVDLES